MTPSTSPSTRLASWVVDQLVAREMTDAVLCPGSRNAPLSFALAADERVTLHTRIDERTAGFLALGLAKGSHRPVAVVTTSGTAAANLHPAVLEAAHAGVPVVAVTADRPARLRGTGANQTTDQSRLFGDAASFVDLTEPADDALAAAWFPDGPIHLNCQFDDPLLPDADMARSSGRTSPTSVGSQRPDGRFGPRNPTLVGSGDPYPLPPGPRTVVIAGDDAGPPARGLAERAGWPLLAEPSSGSRTGANPIRTYRMLLGTDLGPRIERAVVFGHPTLSRPVAQLLSRKDVEVVSVRARGRWPARPYPVSAEHEAVSATEGNDSTWLQEWRAADRSLSSRIDAFVAKQPGLTPYEVAAAVNAANPPGGLVFLGASNPIRDLDLMATAHPVGERRMVLANRGLAGIDGTVSSAIGAALGRPHSSRAIAYVGDVTFLHDSNALVLGPREARPDLTIVVANDDGGSIFATLEQGKPEHAASYDLLFGTPHGVDLASLCAASRTPHWRVSELTELQHALASPNGGIEVIEAVIRRDNRRELDVAIRALAD
ncbi:MAG: 2-succinyl-5-enolpyruvyl-6-hydroxy-3-cyclohexene-1-carboxylic-acid synthase [Marmoricola sp.]